MSGYKRATVSINRDEYERLREAEKKLRDLPQAAKETQERIAGESQAFFQASLEEMEKRQAGLHATLAGMSQYVQELEHNTSQAMVAFEASAMRDMENYAGNLATYFDQLIQHHARQYEDVIARTHRQYQEDLGQLARRVRRLAGSQQKKRVIAEEWLSAAGQLNGYIRDNYACQFFLPGRIERLEQQLEQARQNLALGLSEAAIAASQQLYLAFSDIRVELERLQTEWQVLYSAAHEALSQESSLVEHSRVVRAVDLDGNPLDYLVNVEYWTEGRLQEVLDSLSTMREYLEDPQQVPDSAVLSQWLTVEIPNLHNELEEIVLDARISAINSQLRINIADLVVQALNEQGFSLSNADYDYSDMRLGYGMQLTNLEGNQVVVQVEPIGTSIGDNELQISSLDSQQRTEHELVQRWNEISRSLSSFGLDVGQYTRRGADTPQRVIQPSPSKVDRSQQRRSG